jgi:hypothetical protein
MNCKQNSLPDREPEVLLQEMLFALPFGVVVIDPNTREIEQVNEHIVELFGADKGGRLVHPNSSRVLQSGCKRISLQH